MSMTQFDDGLLKLSAKATDKISHLFKNIDDTFEFNQLKVLFAMQKNRLSDAHFATTTGYGYNDLGRDTLEDIYADVFKAESALVRSQIVSGTHALNLALAGNLKHGDELLSPVGAPYDTLLGVIGIRKTKGSLMDNGVVYKQIELTKDGSFDYPAIKNSINPKTKLITIQRSKGYSLRPSFTIEQIGELIAFVKKIKPDVICMVDNCYGEFVEKLEPVEIGADLAVGSLIKNPGGGLAPCGGYIVGKEEFVENAAVRLTAPGLGKDVGPNLGMAGLLTQGLFNAPQVVASSVKGAIFAAELFSQLGFDCYPKPDAPRTDIVQAIILNNSKNVIAFCEGIQKAAPVDSFVTPVPSGMPGYGSEVIMAAGAFVQGSSIELSADAPLREPFAVFLQGGLTYPHAKFGAMMAAQNMYNKGVINL